MKSLFPEMENEIRDDRKAARREQEQRARRYLQDRDTTWVLTRLIDDGPQTDMKLMMERLEHGDSASDAAVVLSDLWALWLIRKLWRSCVEKHHIGSGESVHLYGIRKVHPKPDS